LPRIISNRFKFSPLIFFIIFSVFVSVGYAPSCSVHLEESGSGVAKFVLGVNRARLSLPAVYVSGDAARLAYDVGGMRPVLGELTQASYRYKVNEITAKTLSLYDGYIKGSSVVEPLVGPLSPAYGCPYLVISLDLTGDGNTDAWVVQVPYAMPEAMPLGVFHQDVIDPSFTPFHVASLIGPSPFPIGTDWGSLNEVKSASTGGYILGNGWVTEIKLAIGNWDPLTGPTGPIEVEVDGITINGEILCPGEPVGGSIEPLTSIFQVSSTIILAVASSIFVIIRRLKLRAYSK
jgi:hypothetical protein